MSRISKQAREDLNYLNLKEIRELCDNFEIPYRILYLKNGRTLKTSSVDRKDVLITRLVEYLETGVLPNPTVLSQKVVDLAPMPKQPTETHLLKYGQFKHGHTGQEKLLAKLSDGKFKDGAIARDVLRTFWVEGKAPTYKQFLKAWYKAVEAHSKPKAEWAYLTDLADGMDMANWKKYRIERAERAIEYVSKRFRKK